MEQDDDAIEGGHLKKMYQLGPEGVGQRRGSWGEWNSVS